MARKTSNGESGFYHGVHCRTTERSQVRILSLCKHLNAHQHHLLHAAHSLVRVFMVHRRRVCLSSLTRTEILLLTADTSGTTMTAATAMAGYFVCTAIATS